MLRALALSNLIGIYQKNQLGILSQTHWSLRSIGRMGRDGMRSAYVEFLKIMLEN